MCVVCVEGVCVVESVWVEHCILPPASIQEYVLEYPYIHPSILPTSCVYIDTYIPVRSSVMMVWCILLCVVLSVVEVLPYATTYSAWCSVHTPAHDTIHVLHPGIRVSMHSWYHPSPALCMHPRRVWYTEYTHTRSSVVVYAVASIHPP